MRSIYESAREVMEITARGGALPNQPNFLDRLSNALSPSANRKRAEADVASNKEKIASNTLAAANTKAKEQNASSTLAAANTKSKIQASVTPAKPATKPGQATMAAGPSQDKLNATQRSAEKSGPDLNAMKKGIAAGAPAAAEAPKSAMDKGPDDAGTQKTASSYSNNAGQKSAMDSVNTTNASAAADKPVEAPTAEKPQAAATPAPAADNTVKSGSGGTVTTSDGSPLKTRSDDEIGDTDSKTGKVTPGSYEKRQQQGQENLKKLKGVFGMKESTINKKFNITDALYHSVMEVMKKDSKEGSIPRNEKEKDLAAFHGDPKRITHGDVLKARGVTREEAELEENTFKYHMDKAIAADKNGDTKKKADHLAKATTAKHAFKAADYNDSENNKLLDTHRKMIMSEEAEPVDELSKKTLGSYVKASAKDAEDAGRDQEHYGHKNDYARGKKRQKGIVKAVDRLTKEEDVEESVDEGMGSTAKSMAKKVLNKLGGGSDEDQRKDLQKKMGMPQTGKKPMKEAEQTDEAQIMSHQATTTMKHIPNASPALKKAAKDIKPGVAGYRDRIAMLKAGGVKENKDTPGNSYEHQCAVHVKSESFGEGRTITTQHASPDADGNIEWYDVMFEHGIERYVPTNTLEILVSEMHMHSKKKKKMM